MSTSFNMLKLAAQARVAREKQAEGEGPGLNEGIGNILGTLGGGAAGGFAGADAGDYLGHLLGQKNKDLVAGNAVMDHLGRAGKGLSGLADRFGSATKAVGKGALGSGLASAPGFAGKLAKYLSLLRRGGAVGGGLAGILGGAALGGSALSGVGSYFDKNSSEKRANIGILKGLGGLADDAIRYGGKALGSGFMTGMKQPGLIPKGLTLGAYGIGGTAANEALASAGLPHIGGSEHWSPHRQGLRNQEANARGPLASLTQMATRPIQSTMHAMGWTPPAGGAGDFINNIDKGDATVQSQGWDPQTGEARYRFGGGGKGQMDPAFLSRMEQIKRDVAQLKAMGISIDGLGGDAPGRGGSGSGGGSNSHIFRFEDQPPGLSLGSTY